MKLIRNRFTSLLLLFVIVCVLSACGASLQKPTGLEKPESIQEVVREDQIELDPAEPASNVTKETEVELEDTDDSEAEKVVPVTPNNTVEKETKPAPKEIAQAKNELNTTDKSLSKPSDSKPESDKKTVTPAVDPSKKPVVSIPASKPVETPVVKHIEKEVQPEKIDSTIIYSIVISSNEVPLPPTKMEIADGDTVLSALIEITQKQKIQMDYRGGQGASAYVEGIDNVYEFDRGQGSGWMYRVNGIFPDRGAGAVPLLAGDRVEWLYTTNLGVDLNADLKPFRR